MKSMSSGEMAWRESVLSSTRSAPGARGGGYGALAISLVVCGYVLSFAVPLPWQFSMAVLVLAAVAAGLHPELAPWPRGSTYELAVVFVALLAMSIPFSVDVGRSLRYSSPLLPGLLFGSLVVMAPGGRAHLKRLFLAFSTLAAILAPFLVVAALASTSADPHDWIRRVDQTLLLVKNDVTLLALIAPLSLSGLILSGSTGVRLLLVVSLLGTAAAAALFQSRGAVTGLIFGLLATLVFQGRSARRWGLAVLGLLAAAVAADLWMGGPLTSRFVELVDHAMRSRFDQWGIAWRVFLDSPVLGAGPHTFGVFYADAPWPHNAYLEILAGSGFLVAAAFVAALAHGLWTSWRLRAAPDREVMVLASGAFGALVVFCLTATVELTFLREWVALMFFFLLATITRLNVISEPLNQNR